MWAAGAIAIAAFGLSACNRAAPHQEYTAAQFHETLQHGISANGPYAFSQDGATVLISSDASGVINTYALPTAGGDATALTELTAGAARPLGYFPNDGRVLYAADVGGNELDHLYVRGEDGQVRDITPGERLRANFLGWSADGATFYVTTNERDPSWFDLYAYNATDFSRRLLFQNTGHFVDAVSRDGRWAALRRETSSSNGDVYVVDLNATGAARAPRLITQHTGNAAFAVFTFTPDSTALIYGTDEHGEFRQAWSYNLSTQAKAPVIEAEWDVQSLTFSNSGRYRVTSINADGSTQTTILDTQSNNAVALSGLPNADVTAVRFNRDETQAALLVVSDTSPPDIYMADLANGQTRRLTTALNPDISEDMLVNAEVTRFAARDGVQVPGILYRPRTATAENKAPAVVFVHGGPGDQSRRGYNPTVQHLVNHGYAVYLINNRGSSGYGKTFYHMDDRRHGEVDLADVVESRAYLSSLDWIDGSNVAIMGGSYGGYMVAAALAFQPEAFDVGINLYGVTNWPRTLLSVPAYWAAQRQRLYDELGDPNTDVERMTRISPYFHAENIRRPLLVLQGLNDPRVLPPESEEIVAKVRANNVPVEYIAFPDEGHGFQRRANRITASEAYLSFLDRYLVGDGTAPAPASGEQPAN
ncbi:putative peptidase [alpha proteobacterium U9-1i]|nr:putative peptidase [alpha proteobacterium U9-1i]